MKKLCSLILATIVLPLSNASLLGCSAPQRKGESGVALTKEHCLQVVGKSKNLGDFLGKTEMLNSCGKALELLGIDLESPIEAEEEQGSDPFRIFLSLPENVKVAFDFHVKKVAAFRDNEALRNLKGEDSFQDKDKVSAIARNFLEESGYRSMLEKQGVKLDFHIPIYSGGQGENGRQKTWYVGVSGEYNGVLYDRHSTIRLTISSVSGKVVAFKCPFGADLGLPPSVEPTVSEEEALRVARSFAEEHLRAEEIPDSWPSTAVLRIVDRGINALKSGSTTRDMKCRLAWIVGWPSAYSDFFFITVDAHTGEVFGGYLGQQ